MLPGHIYSEVANPCPDQSCVLAAIPQYLNRLFLRPDEFLALTRRIPWVFALLCLILGYLLLWLRPWDWSTVRPALFGVAWVVVGSLMFILTLWPYFDDRFMYVADMGFAILAGSVAAEVKRLWHGSTKDQRARLVAVATVFLFWFGSGIPMLVVRGQDWIAAGLQAEAIVDGVHGLLPDPPSGSVLAFMSVPRMASPGITPGEIGPYVFNNGLAAALRLSYGHGGFSVLIGEPPADEGGPVIVFDVKGSKVTLLGPPVTLTVSGLKSPRSQASTGSIRVTVVDADGNRTKWYRGTVHFTSSDPAAKLPDDYTFTAADAGTHVFSVTLEAAGSQTISATDKATPGITGFQTVSVT